MASRISLGQRNVQRTCASQLVAIALALGFTACADDTPSEEIARPRQSRAIKDGAASQVRGDRLEAIIRMPLSYAGGGSGGIAVEVGGMPGGTTSGGSGGGSGSTTTSPLLVSAYCGDAIRDPAKEECDDGHDSHSPTCTWACQISDAAVARAPVQIPAEARLLRRLGRGRHPIGATETSFAVASVETTTKSHDAIVVLSTYDEFGSPIVAVDVGQGSALVDTPDPVVAPLPDGDFAVAYTDFDGDGDGLGIALRRVRHAAQTPDPVQAASEPGFAGQYDADILALGDRVLVAYTDEFDAVSAPDVRVREFSLGLQPTGTSMMLGNSSDFEGKVALAKLDDSWGAVWRTGHPDGTESIEAYDAASQARWKIDLSVGGHVDDVPAMVELNATQRLLAYTISTDPDGDGSYATGELEIAVVDTSAPGVAIGAGSLLPVPTSSSWANQGVRRPGLVKIGTAIYVTWSSYSATVAANVEDVGLQQLSVSVEAGRLKVGLGAELSLPRWPSALVGDQRFPALAGLTPNRRYPSGALVSAWEDYKPVAGFAQGGEPEVMTQLAPLPLRRDAAPISACSPNSPCSAGQPGCTDATACVSPLVCGLASGPYFDWGTNVGVCVPAHCTNGIKDSTETKTDCGGPDCGSCTCGDGVVSEALGEQCDLGTAGNDGTICKPDCTTKEAK